MNKGIIRTLLLVIGVDFAHWNGEYWMLWATISAACLGVFSAMTKGDDES